MADPNSTSFSPPKTTAVDYTSGTLDPKHKWTPDSINAAAKQMTSLALSGQHDTVNHLVNNPGDLEKYASSGFRQLPQIQPTAQPTTQAQPTVQPQPQVQSQDQNQRAPTVSAASGATNGGNVGSNLFRAMAYGPSQNEYTHDTLNGPLGKLQQGDIAVSPNMLGKYPLGSYVNVVDKDGNVLRSNMRVADYSYTDPQHPNSNTFELWNDQDLGNAGLVSVGAPSSNAQTPVQPRGQTPTVQTPTQDNGGSSLQRDLDLAQAANRLGTTRVDDPQVVATANDPNANLSALQNATQGD